MMAGQAAHFYARCQFCANLTWQHLHLSVAQSHHTFLVADLTDITAKLVTAAATCKRGESDQITQDSTDLP